MNYRVSEYNALDGMTISHTIFEDGLVLSSLLDARGWFVTQTEGTVREGSNLSDLICRLNDEIYDRMGWTEREA